MDEDVFELHARMEREHWWFAARRVILHRLVHLLATPHAERSIVDVGCGTGGNIGPLVTGFRCTGVDPNVRALEVARRRYPGVQFHQGTTADLRELGLRADCLLLTDVLEHIREDRSAYLDSLAAVRPGGRLLITVPANPKLFGHHDTSHGHFRRYTRDSLGRLVRHPSGRTLMISHFNSRLYPLVRAARSLGSLTGKSFGAAGTDLRLPPPLLNRALARIFAGEGARLERALVDSRDAGYSRGTSLIAVIEKEGGAAPAGCRQAESSPAPRGRS